jgi:magnesium transporter
MKEKNVSKKIGMPPGTLIHIGKKSEHDIKISIIDYTENEFHEFTASDFSECFAYKNKDSVSWINIDGLHQTEIIGNIGKHFEIHPLALEDILNTKHRPKSEEFENYIFLIFKMIGFNKSGDSLIFEQVSLLLGNNWVISFQEEEGDILDTLRSRIRESKGNIRKKGADYLFYRLIDIIVDNYFLIIEKISDTTEKMEKKALLSTSKDTMFEIQVLKKQLMKLRKAVSPLREAIGSLLKDANPLIEESTHHYLRDVNEHVIHMSEAIETQREILSNIMDLYLSGLSNKTNQVMQLLTIISTIFIPLTFIAGIYGMNFENMPELKWEYGYFIVWAIMIGMIGLMLYFFKRKKWL